MPTRIFSQASTGDRSRDTQTYSFEACYDAVRPGLARDAEKVHQVQNASHTSPELPPILAAKCYRTPRRSSCFPPGRPAAPTRLRLAVFTTCGQDNSSPVTLEELFNDLDRLHSRMLRFIRDYLPKTTVIFPLREYLLPNPSSVRGDLVFKGQTVKTRFDTESLSGLERKLILR